MLGALILVVGRKLVGKGGRSFEVNAHTVAQHIYMGLPDDGQHDRIDMARIVTEILRLLDQRGIGCKGETLLQEFEVDTETAHEALRTIVAPSKAGGIDTPHPLHLLFGVEAGAGHAVTAVKPSVCCAEAPCQQHTAAANNNRFLNRLFIIALSEIIEHAARGVHAVVHAVIILIVIVAVTLLLGFLGAFLGLAAQALGLTFLKRARKRLHRHGSEQGVHVDRELDLPVGFRGKGVFAFVVGIDFGAFGLAAFDHIARVPLAVAVLVSMTRNLISPAGRN